jgi:hypothetical protein
MVIGRTRTTTDRLAVGGELLASQSLVSADGGCRLDMQRDGNLVIYNRAGKATWSTDTWNLPAGIRPVKAVLTRSGSLVLLDAMGLERWSSRSDVPGVDRMVLQNDGALVIFAGIRQAWSSTSRITIPKFPTIPTKPGPFVPMPPGPIVPRIPQVDLSRNQSINGFGRLQGAIESTQPVGSAALTDVNASGVNYRVTQQKFAVIKNVLEQSYLRDIASMGVWPGQVIQGNPLKSGSVAPIGPFPRVPGTMRISTEFVANTSVPQHADIANPTGAALDQARREIVSRIAATDSAGQLETTFETASTLREVGIKAGLNISGSAFGVDANMTLNQTFSQSCAMAVIRQVYYSVEFDPSAAQSEGFWPESVTMNQLGQYMGAGNPPLYISSVKYGRLVCVLAEGKFSSSDLAASLEARYSSTVEGKVNGSLNWKDVLSSSQVTVYTLGVPGWANFQTLSRPVEELDAVFRNGLSFGPKNPGAPVSFTARHIADGTDAYVALAAQYTQAVSAIASDVAPTAFEIWDGKGGGTVNTGIYVNPGDHVTVHTRGAIWSGVVFSGEHGPEGWPGHRPDPAAPLPEGPNAYACIISFGGQNWTHAGTDWEGTPPSGARGRLSIGINDNNPYNGDPNKRWRATVTVRRGNAASAGVYI